MITERKTLFTLGGATIPASFTYNSAQPNYHQELLAYVILKNIEGQVSAGFEAMQATDTLQKVIDGASIDSDTGEAYASINARTPITLEFPYHDGAISYRGQ